MAVLVLNKRKMPLMPCSEKRARLLLRRGRAVVVRLYPFTIRLKDRIGGAVQPVRLKLDPGSRTTGIALVRERESIDQATGGARCTVVVLSLMELTYRGRQISKALMARRALRRGRRRKTRYRTARFLNRRRPKGWLAPSLQHRVDTTLAWVRRLSRWAPVAGISQELVRFDTQQLQNPEIGGAEYQRGTLFGYELREYLLEKWDRKCAYCDAEGTPLQVEHIVPKCRGGSGRVSNLTLACRPCNESKDDRDIREFLARDPARLEHILAQAKAPLKDVAAVNATRWALYSGLKATGLAVQTATGGRTKWNRSRLGIPKTHALDAVCVGEVDTVSQWWRPTLSIKATGRGSYQRTRLTVHGFPRGYLMRSKQVHGFQTGDIVRAVVPSGKKSGSHVGRVAVRASGRFNIQTPQRVVQGVSQKYCRLIQRNDGYGYFFQPKTASTKGEAGPGRVACAALSLPGLAAGGSRAN